MTTPKIFVGVPNMGMIGTSMAYRIREWYHTGHLEGKYELTIVETTGFRPLEVSFNKLHEMFLETDCDYFFTINDDEDLQSDALDILLAHDKDIVIPLGLRWDNRQGPMPCVGVREGADDVGLELSRHFTDLDIIEAIDATERPVRYINPITGYKGLKQCDRVGNSGILIKRHVMEALPVGSFRYELNENHTGVVATEDYVMCDVLRSLGFEIWVDCALVLNHFKKVNLLAVRKLMVSERLIGQGDTAKALNTLILAGASPEEAIEGIHEWFAERQEEVFPQKVTA